MKDEKTTESTGETKAGRRRLLKAIAGGGGALAAGANLPDKWKKPVIDTIMLPAHAQTTPPPEDIDNTPVMSCQLTVNEGTGGEPPSQLFTTSGSTTLGCIDGGVDIGDDGGPDIQTTILRYGTDPVPDLTVQLDVNLTGMFGGGGFTGTATAITDANGVASGFDFGGGNDIFQVGNESFGPPWIAEFCFSVPDRPAIIPCCIVVTFDCPEED